MQFTGGDDSAAVTSLDLERQMSNLGCRRRGPGPHLPPSRFPKLYLDLLGPQHSAIWPLSEENRNNRDRHQRLVRQFSGFRNPTQRLRQCQIVGFHRGDNFTVSLEIFDLESPP